MSALVAIAAAAPSLTHVPLTYAAAPYYQKSVHYAAEPVVTGYSHSILKPSLGYAIDAPAYAYAKQAVYAPRAVVVQPHIGYQKYIVDTPVVAKVGHVVESVPTAVSHQSSTVVHSKAAVVTPVVAPAYAKTIVSAPVAYSSVHAW